MKKLKKNYFIYAGLTFLQIIFLIFMSVAFSSTAFANKEAELSVFSSLCPNKADAYSYVNVDYIDNNRNSICEQLFTMEYSNNFSRTSTRLLAVSDNAEVASFQTFVNNEQLPFSSAVTSGYTYTNDKDLVRFETVCINLFKYRERTEELAYDPGLFDGFVFIPDYYADYIIQNFYPSYEYSDLIDEANDCCFSLKYGDNEFRYKIANIFHVSGFKDEYIGKTTVTYNDYNTGKKLDQFFNGYCFVSNYGHFSSLDSNFHTTMFYQIDSKRYDLDEVLKSSYEYKNYFSINDVDANIYYSSNGKTSVYKNSDSVIKSYFERTQPILWQFIIAIALGILFVASFLLLFFKKPFSINLKICTAILAHINILFMFTSFVLKTVLSSNISISLFFNIPIMIVCVTFLIVFGILFFVELNKRRKTEIK